MRHLLLIGNGYVGQLAAKLFREAGWKVTTVSRGGSGDQIADVSSYSSLVNLAERIDPPTHVLHCASASGGGEDVYQAVYLQGCQNLVRVFPRTHKLFTSSTSVYSQQNGELVCESSAVNPKRITGRILLDAESTILSVGGTVARLAGIYGPGKSYLLRRFLAGQSVLEQEGQRIVNYIHQLDAARACLHLFTDCQQSCGEVFNVCDSHPKSQLETYQELSEVFSLPLPESGPRAEFGKRGWSNKAVSNAKLLASGWSPKFPSFTAAAQGIAATL